MSFEEEGYASESRAPDSICANRIGINSKKTLFIINNV